MEYFLSKASQGMATEDIDPIRSDISRGERIGWHEEWQWRSMSYKHIQTGRQKPPIILCELVASETSSQKGADSQEVKVQWVTVE